MAEFRAQQIIEHISHIDSVIHSIEQCIMQLQKETFICFAKKGKHSGAAETPISNSKYEQTINTYLANIEWLKKVRSNWLNSL